MSDIDDVRAMSYRYVRLAMIGLLIALMAAVLHQSWQQRALLASVSAYYYTSAQAVFVGALIGLGVCMVALKGATAVENFSLNCGGLCAALVAIIPTARGVDYQTAVDACRKSNNPLLTQTASSGLDCPTVQAMSDATTANVVNNLLAFLVMAFLGLATTAAYLYRDRRAATGSVAYGEFLAAATLWLAGLSLYFSHRDWVVDKGHFVAAIGFFLSIFVVALLNGHRSAGTGLVGASRPRQALMEMEVLVLLKRHDGYTWIARVMVVIALASGVMAITGVLTIFWLEVAVTTAFAAFWVVQTLELERTPAPGAAA